MCEMMKSPSGTAGGALLLLQEGMVNCSEGPAQSRALVFLPALAGQWFRSPYGKIRLASIKSRNPALAGQWFRRDERFLTGLQEKCRNPAFAGQWFRSHKINNMIRESKDKGEKPVANFGLC